jgi:hypothetical protein
MATFRASILDLYWLAAAAMLAALLSGCGRDAGPPATIAATPPRAGVVSATNAAAEPLLVTVYKTPTCGCCTAWTDYLEANGFAVELHDLDDLSAIKDELRVPRDLRSCHTAHIGEHVIEGHVPVGDIRRFLATESSGVLAVPGMPLGSPGMEDPDGRVMPYDSVLVRADGVPEVFQHHPGKEALKQ